MLIKDIFKDNIYKGVRIEDKGNTSFESYVIDTKDVENCVINYKNIGIKKINMDINDKYLLKPKDIIVASIPSNTTSHVGYAQDDLEDRNVIIKKNFFILRNPIDRYNPEFVAEYLDNIGIKLFCEQNNLYSLTKQDIEKIDIPNISIEKQNEAIEVIRLFNRRIRYFNLLINNQKDLKLKVLDKVMNDE